MKEKRLYVVTHEHRFGTSAYIVRANHCPTEQEVVTALDIDFEPDRAETISIGSVEPGDIKDIPDRPEGPVKSGRATVTGRCKSKLKSPPRWGFV